MKQFILFERNSPIPQKLIKIYHTINHFQYAIVNITTAKKIV